GVRFEYVPAGPAAALTQDRLLPQLGTFSNELARRWQQSPPDIVHAHFWTSGLAALGAARGTGVPVIQTFHTLGAPRKSVMSVDQAVLASQTAEQAVVRTRMERLVAKTVHTVLADSSAELDTLTGLGVPRTTITVVPPGVDTTTFGPAGPAARRGKRRRLLAAAPGSAEHGLETVIQALATLPGAELMIAGGPPRAEIRTDPILQDLARLADRAGVSDRVMFTGKVTRARIPALLRSADLFVHVAGDEATGILPVEAMACGTAVVAAAGGADR